MSSPRKNCCICIDPDAEDNPIVTCKKCSVSVHKYCYGIASVKEKWKCSPCSSKTSDPVCQLCEQTGSAMKTTLCGNWVHIICALFTDGVIFEDKDRMEKIDISKISESKRNKKCIFCDTTLGFSPLCSQSKCRNRLHITCAQKDNCLKEVINKQTETIKFRAYCPDHKPNFQEQENRRISSQFVREILSEKRKKEQQKKLQQQQNQQKNQSAIENSEWITQRAKQPVAKSQQPIKFLNDAVIEEPVLETESHGASNSDEMNSRREDMWWDDNDIREEDPLNSIIADDGHDSAKENIICDEHICFKDIKIDKVKKKNMKLKGRLEKLEDLNAQLQNVNIQLQERLLGGGVDRVAIKAPSAIDMRLNLATPVVDHLKKNRNILKILESRISKKLSDDNTDLIYANGVKVPVQLAKQMETISEGPSSDRMYVNTLFFIFFPEDYVRKQVTKKLKREQVLAKFRSSKKYETMKDLYDYRVLLNGKGNIPQRLRIFKLCFRQKLNNWWTLNARKEKL